MYKPLMHSMISIVVYLLIFGLIECAPIVPFKNGYDLLNATAPIVFFDVKNATENVPDARKGEAVWQRKEEYEGIKEALRERKELLRERKELLKDRKEAARERTCTGCTIGRSNGIWAPLAAGVRCKQWKNVCWDGDVLCAADRSGSDCGDAPKDLLLADVFERAEIFEAHEELRGAEPSPYPLQFRPSQSACARCRFITSKDDIRFYYDEYQFECEARDDLTCGIGGDDCFADKHRTSCYEPYPRIARAETELHSDFDEYIDASPLPSAVALPGPTGLGAAPNPPVIPDRDAYDNGSIK